MLHADNEPAHTSLLVGESLAKHETTAVTHMPNSPDLDPVPPPRVEIQRSPISDGTRDRRKFATGPMRYPAKAFHNGK
jgi:hypothetical protein